MTTTHAVGDFVTSPGIFEPLAYIGYIPPTKWLVGMRSGLTYELDSRAQLDPITIQLELA